MISVVIASVVAAGIVDAPMNFVAKCSGLELIIGERAPVSWRINLHIAQIRRQYSIDGGRTWKPVLPYPYSYKQYLLSLTSNPGGLLGVNTEIMDLDKRTYLYMGLKRVSGLPRQVVDQGTCIILPEE
jgi:hypothetical protein